MLSLLRAFCAPRRSHQPRRPRLGLETLEGRVVPATLTPGTEVPFIQSLYQDVLGRAGNEQEVAGWLRVLESGATVESVTEGFFRSDEQFARRVRALYENVLERPADPNGLAGFVALLRAGGSDRDVLTAMLTSAEYDALHPADPDFVASVFQDALGREADQTGLSVNLAFLAAGGSRAAVVQGVLTSAERAEFEVDLLFANYLGRDADPDARASMSAASLSGITFAQLAVGILSSQENMTQSVTQQSAPAGTQVNADGIEPRVVGASSLSNTTVLVSFSEPMADNALDPAHYFIVQENVNPEVGFLIIKEAKFRDAGRTSVELTTASQNEVTYTITALAVTDLAGNALAPEVLAGTGQKVAPTRATFAGTPPSGRQLVDADGDGLNDNVEQRGYVVTVTLADGTRTTRQVTSDPANADTDGDGLSDRQERNLVLDPRDADTDGDQLGDFQEFNEIFSDATKQDSDGDGLDDSLEFGFFRTSVVHADTDGDQLADGDEVLLASRNPQVADLPLPAIEVGEVNLSLDVRFDVTDADGTRQLDARTVNSTLTQSDEKKFSNTDGNTSEFAVKAAREVNFGISQDGISFGVKSDVERSFTGQWTSSFTQESSTATQRELARSFQTDEEVTQEQTVQRTIQGARMSVTVSVKSIGGISFSMKDLEITAFLQDPRNPGRLVPIATLVPRTSNPDGLTLNLGPLVPSRGPFVFENDQIFPALVEQLMLDPKGLIFKIANFNVTDEAGRNFAFTSQTINERTAPLVIDFGGAADVDGDTTFGTSQEGDFTERYRIATSAGRAVTDTNGDGTIDGADDRVVFDANGKAVGITLKDALEGVLGLRHFDEDANPSASLSSLQLEGSYSTKAIDGVETLWRVRTVAREAGNRFKTWEVITPDGIDRSVQFSDRVLLPEKGLTLAFLEDADDDGVPAVWEAVSGGSDNNQDSDGDGLTDGFEFFGKTSDPANPGQDLVWTVNAVGKAGLRAFSSLARVDSDLDGLSDFAEFNRFVDVDGVQVRRSTDPKNPDTDGDGVLDGQEVFGYTIQPRPVNGQLQPPLRVVTDPLDPDTDNDTLSDGDERTRGLDPTKLDSDRVLDDDRDGLVNADETTPRKITVFLGTQTVGTEVTVTSNPSDADSDDDGLNDRQEFDLKLNPNSNDTDGDGLKDNEEVLVTVVDGVVTFRENTDPRRADTDGDGFIDLRELQLGTNPRERDQLVEFRLSVLVESIPEGIGTNVSPPTLGKGEWRGQIAIERLGGTATALLDLSALDSLNATERKDVSVQLIVKPGESYRIFSVNTFEQDSGTDDDDLPEFERVFNFVTLPASAQSFPVTQFVQPLQATPTTPFERAGRLIYTIATLPIV